MNLLHNISVIFDRVNLLSKICLKHFLLIEKELEKQEKQLQLLEIINKKIRKNPSIDEVAELINSIIDQPKKSEKGIIQIAKSLEKRSQNVEELIEKLYQQLI